MSSPPGREARAAARRTKAAGLARARIAETLPWLWQRTTAPDDAEARLRDLFNELTATAPGIEAAKQATDALHDVVDAWNAHHPQTPLPAPPSIASVRTRNPGWSLARLERLRRWRPWGAALTARLAVPARPDPAPAAAGLVLASAIRNGGLGDPVFLAVLARWLAAPDVPLRAADGLPLWLDLKARRHRPEPAGEDAAADADVPSGLLSRVRTESGADAQGPYALRRWFVDPDSLNAMAVYFEAPASDADRAAIGTAAESRAGLTGLIRRALDPDGTLGRPPGLTSLIDGAFAELEAGPTGLDTVTSGVARGRLRWASPTPETWEATFRAASGDTREAFPALETEPTPPDPDPEDVEDVEDDALARREARAFSALHALMAQAGPDRHRGLVADDTRLTPQGFARMLAAARKDTTWWPSAARLALDWYCVLAGTLAPASVRRYHAAISDRFLDCAGDLALETADTDALGQVIVEALEEDPRSARERALARKLLRRLHRFGVEDPHWRLPEVDQSLFETGAGDDDALSFRITPRLISAAAFDGARSLIRAHPELDIDGRLAVEAAMILQRRCGLRIGEVCKAALADLEPADDNPVLFIRPNRFGSNKTRAARRAVRPYALGTAEEADTLRRWVLRRRLIGGEGPLIALATPVGLARIAPASLAALIADVLRRASGQNDISDHTLRHGALTDLERALTEARNPSAHLLVDRGALRDRLCGLTVEEAARAADTVCPAVRRRDGLAALAAHAGHRSAGTTLTSYVHGWDLRVFEAVARCVTREEYDRLVAPIADRIVRIETTAESGALLPGISASAPDLVDPLELIKALELREAGQPRADVAVAARLSEADLDAAETVARELSKLKTRKGTSRLFPGGAAGRLAPPTPRSIAERREGKALLRELWKLRRSQRPDLVWWCAANLLRATRSNPGLRLTSPGEVGHWRALTSGLSPRRWALHLEGPRDTADRADWEEACPPGSGWRGKTGARSVTAIVRLPRPDAEGPGTRLDRVSDDYASGAPLFAAHALAIALDLTPRDLALSLRSVSENAENDLKAPVENP